MFTRCYRMEHMGHRKSYKPAASCLFHDRVSNIQVRQSTDKLQQAFEWKKNLDSGGRKSFGGFTVWGNWFQASSFFQRETITWNYSFHSRYEKLQDAYTRFQATTLSGSTPSSGILLLPYPKWNLQVNVIAVSRRMKLKVSNQFHPPCPALPCPAIYCQIFNARI